MYKLYYLYIPW